jgi:hypothetical protein
MAFGKIPRQILRALQRARFGILTVGLTYVLAVLVGMALVHAGNGFALAQRDSLVARAMASDHALAALDRGQRLQAALWDFGGNLTAAVANTVGGIEVIPTYPNVAYRGWVGGIVSVDSAHVSRLPTPSQPAPHLPNRPTRSGQDR